MGLFLPYQKYGTFFLPEFSARKMESGKFRQQPPFIRPRSARLVQAYISVIKRKITGPSAVYISVSWAKCFVSRSPTFPLKLLLPPPFPSSPSFPPPPHFFSSVPSLFIFLFTLRGWTPTCAFYFQIYCDRPHPRNDQISQRLPVVITFTTPVRAHPGNHTTDFDSFACLGRTGHP